MQWWKATSDAWSLPTNEEDLAKEVLEIITVFSARLYGSRSRKNQKLLEDVRAVAEKSQC